jgi:hypothetical protein
MFSNSLIIAFALFMVRFIALEATYQKAKRTSTGFRFPVGIGLRVMFRVGGPFLIYASYKASEQIATNAGRIVSVIVALMGLGCILAEPAEIITSAAGLKQKFYLGLKSRFIPWERAAARYVPGLQEVLVIGKNGVSITHSQYHVGQQQFLHELQRRQVFLQGVRSLMK